MQGRQQVKPILGNLATKPAAPSQAYEAPNLGTATRKQVILKGVPKRLSKQAPTLSKPNDAPELTKAQKEQILLDISKRQVELPLLTIVGSAISLYSWEDMERIAGKIEISNSGLSGGGSVNDPRMGVVSLNVACQFCAQIDCPGHYGLINFRAYIYNPAYIRDIVSVLTCVCIYCGKLIIGEDMMRQLGYLNLSYNKRLAALEAYCKDVSCRRRQGEMQGGEVIACKKNPIFITTDIAEKGEITYKIPVEGKKTGKKASSKPDKDDPVFIMSIDLVMGYLSAISDSDAKLLGFPEGSHPRNMILRGILVPPIIARPPVFEGVASHHDQLTHMYKYIMEKVEGHTIGKEGALKDLYTLVQQLIFKSEGKKMGMKEFLSIVERIQGKTALLRGLLMGKRTNHCGRTVAGPDPSLRYGQIGIPQAWAPILTKKVAVTDYNIHILTALLEAGRITHITSKKTGLRKYYDAKKRTRPGDIRLRPGDIVERWLQDGDRVVTNRQPTLHKLSMMAYEVVLGYQLTIRLHLSYTGPMNCDFDGDENNVWNPQDFEVEAELEILMNVKENLMSSEDNRPTMGLVMNSVSGSYLLTDPAIRVDDDLFAELMTLITDQKPLATLYQRLVKYGVHPRSGNAVFSALLPEDFYYNNGDVIILEGIIVSGRLTKSHVGASTRSIIQMLWKNYGAQRTADFLTDAPWVINKWIIEHGFSVGILDCISLATDKNGREYDKNKRILDQELAKIYVQLEALGSKVDDPIEEAFRQRQIKNLVNIAQGIGLRLAKEVLSKDNSIGVMTKQGAGTKGDIFNIGQMMGSVGQQFYKNERLPRTLTRGTRLLPTTDINSNRAEDNGFIPDSFFTGVSPEGLFFLQSGGREGLLDTALKTAETGNIQHRIVKAVENIVVANDGSIRNTIGTLFDPIYNCGYDISHMVTIKDENRPNLSSPIDLKSVVHELNVKRGWVPADINSKIISNRNKISEKDDHVETILAQPAPNYIKGPILTNTSITYNVNDQVVAPDPVSKISKFEKARIIGTRAMQLAENAPPLVDIGDEIDPVRIALKEYSAGLLELFTVRKFSNKDSQLVYPTLDNINP